MKKKILQATHGSSDRPLVLGGMEIPAYVLEDGRRVLSWSGMLESMGMSLGGNVRRPGQDRLTRFVTGNAIKPHVSDELVARTTEPIDFKTPVGTKAKGYEATVLADICEAVLEARRQGALQKQQQHIADQCEILVRGFARVGIIALVDEVTGYQDYRTRKALEEYLQKFISDELIKWVKMFPDDFYKEMFRLKNWHLKPNTARPGVAGRYTIDLVYKRVGPQVLEQLRERTPKLPSGNRKYKYFQHLTEDVGNPALRAHLHAIVALMKASNNWTQFMRSVERAFPKYGDTLELPLTGPNFD